MTQDVFEGIRSITEHHDLLKRAVAPSNFDFGAWCDEDRGIVHLIAVAQDKRTGFVAHTPPYGNDPRATYDRAKLKRPASVLVAKVGGQCLS